MSLGKKSKPSYVYAVIGVSLVLFLLGTLGWMVINGRGLTRVFKEGVMVQVVLHDNVRPEKGQQLSDILTKQPFVKSSKFISRDAAGERFRKELGEDFLQTLEYNPLFPSIELSLFSSYVNKDSMAKVERFLRQSNIVREVSYQTSMVEQMNANFRKLSVILGSVSLLFFVVVIILIDNTVRLAMFSNRFLIKTMQMVGATRFFISKPFDRIAVINGLVSGVIAVAGLWIVISFAESQLSEIKTLHEPVLLAILMSSMIIMGIMISLVSTHRSVVKYLKMHVDDLY